MVANDRQISFISFIYNTIIQIAYRDSKCKLFFACIITRLHHTKKAHRIRKSSSWCAAFDTLDPHVVHKNEMQLFVAYLLEKALSCPSNTLGASFSTFIPPLSSILPYELSQIVSNIVKFVQATARNCVLQTNSQMNRHFDSLMTQLSSFRHTPHEGPLVT